jgi:hypothetical protein
MSIAVIIGIIVAVLLVLAFSRKRPLPKAVEPGQVFTRRLGQSAPVDEVCEAWQSGDLKRMLHAMFLKTNLIDRHFLLLSIVKQTYAKRSDPQMREICRSVGETHIQGFGEIVPALKTDFHGIIPRVPTFQHLATVFAEDRNYDRAIEVCETAIRHGLNDYTKVGFEGRIARIQRQRKQEA